MEKYTSTVNVTRQGKKEGYRTEVINKDANLEKSSKKTECSDGNSNLSTAVHTQLQKSYPHNKK